MGFEGIKSLPLNDPRHFQILTLGILLILYNAVFAPFVTWGAPVIVLTTCLAAQALMSKLYGLKFEPRSALITGLSLSILLKAGSPLILIVAATMAITSKFLIRSNNKHIFNPANIGIVVCLLAFPSLTWVSPAQWGSGLWLAVALICFATMVLHKIPSRFVSISFLVLWALLTFGRAAWLGDPLAIPLKHMQGGALLIFTFFMISDPKTAPNTKIGQFIFALAIAALAFMMQIIFHIREAPFYALALVCALRPIIDKISAGERFEWNKTHQRSVS